MLSCALSRSTLLHQYKLTWIVGEFVVLTEVILRGLCVHHTQVQIQACSRVCSGILLREEVVCLGVRVLLGTD